MGLSPLVVGCLVLVGVAIAALPVEAHGHDTMSRHFVAEDVPATDVVIAGETTEGPYFEDESDYTDGSDMTAAARAGSPGVTVDRAGVLDGIPLSLTLNLFTVDGSTASELANADVFLWHCDALGRYSSVSQQPSEDTGRQKWLRGKQTTAANGSITFNTIVPGWYQGRAVHFHLRVRFAGEVSFAVTTQLFVADAQVDEYKARAPYSSDTQSITYLNSDSIFTSLTSEVRAKLTLSTTGTYDSGLMASLNVGIVSSDEDRPTPGPFDGPVPTFTLDPDSSFESSAASRTLTAMVVIALAACL
jgi:protocatechuate 3,4-dioxygenase beta subunit